MQTPKISGIAVIGRNRVFGKDGGLVFHVPGDLPRFKRITSGHPIIMGRKTFESKEIHKRPLPNRINIVITRDPNYQAEGVVVCDSLQKAIEYAKGKDEQEIFVIGGAHVFAEALPLLDRLYLTVVEKEITGDVYFPDYSEFTKVIAEEKHEVDGMKYSFIDLGK
jgi:dihydrofolate reductase